MPAADATPSSPWSCALEANECFTAVQRFLHRACGVRLDEQGRYLVEARLEPVARELGFTRIAELVRAATSGPDSSPAARALVDAMTTHETLFYRDPPFWSCFAEVILPALLARPRTRPLRIWSAACSTGQEPYTAAMILAERFPSLGPDDVRIIASDVSEASLARAAEGVFSTLEVNRGLGAARLLRHFDQRPGGFQLKPALRARVAFRPFNLVGGGMDPGPVDVALCRNVLIYFAAPERKAAVQRLVRATAPGGFLGVGTTEALSGPTLAPGWYAASPTLA